VDQPVIHGLRQKRGMKPSREKFFRMEEISDKGN
jgi:hypothetical protein